MTVHGEAHLAPFAVRAAIGGRREHIEPADALRGPFELDRHRIIESTAFRRLEHKTQVFAAAHHDHFRTRLTHTLEVAQIARTLAVALGANASLVEAVALAHDLGHPPFGHAGEVALQERMGDHGGFNHNTHALRVVEYLEHPFPAFRGLNLTQAVREGLGRHESRYDIPQENVRGDSPISSPFVEAQIVSVADRLAYNCHDLEDAIGAGFIGFEELKLLALWSQAMDSVEESSSTAPIQAVRRLVLDQLLNSVISDVVNTSSVSLVDLSPVREVSIQTAPCIAPSEAMDAMLRQIEEFLLAQVYRHPEVEATDRQGQAMVSDLFNAYVRHPKQLPPRFAQRTSEQSIERVACDYISGMTDRFCKGEFERIAGTERGNGMI